MIHVYTLEIYNVDSMLTHRLRRWPNIESTLGANRHPQFRMLLVTVSAGIIFMKPGIRSHLMLSAHAARQQTITANLTTI